MSKPADPWNRPVDLGANPTRLPLEVGTSALWNLTRGCILLPPAVGLALVLFRLGGVTCLVVPGALLWLPVLLQGWLNFDDAWSELPSDVLVGKGGLRFESAAQTVALPWSELAPDKCTLVAEQVEDPRLRTRLVSWVRHWVLGIFSALVSDRLAERIHWDAEPKLTVHKLRLVLATGHERDVAIAEADHERASLQAVLDTIRALGTPDDDPPDSGHVKILRCRACGAAVVPAAAPEVRCGYCQATVAVPPKLASRIAAAEALTASASEVERVSRKLLRQPGAARVRAWLRLAMVLDVLAWLASVLLLALVGRLGGTGRTLAVLALVGPAPMGLITAVCLLLRTRFVDRHALRVLTLDYGAQPPRGPGQPHRCRTCGAPLVEPRDRVVVHCVYCGSENVLGLDLSRRSRRVGAELESLGASLARRRRARLSWSALGAVGLLLFIACAGGMASLGTLEHRDFALNGRCRAGDVGACLALERAYRAGTFDDHDGRLLTGVEADACRFGARAECSEAAKSTRDPARRAALWRRACALGDGDLCADAADAEVEGKGLPRDADDAAKLYQRGCRLGSGRSCNALGELLGASADSRRNSTAKIVDLYDQACQKRSARGCENLAEAYDDGQLVERDPARGAVWHVRACELEHDTICNGINKYFLGLDDPQLVNVVAAEKSCLRHESTGCAKVAGWYAKTVQLEQLLNRDASGELVLAIAYSKRACALGDATSCQILSAAGQLPKARSK